MNNLTKNLTQLSLGNIIYKIKKINTELNSRFTEPFPKPLSMLISLYQYQKHYIRINPDGSVQGGTSHLLSLFDFSFIRSLVAHCYSSFGAPSYDPTSIFVLLFCCFLDNFINIKEFSKFIKDPDRGKFYRLLAGVSLEHVPSEDDFTNFPARIGETLYNAIFHTILDIFDQLGFLSVRIISTDGCLFPSYSRYKGCTYFCYDCQHIKVENLLDRFNTRIREFLKEPAKITPGKEHRLFAECPSTNFPEDLHKPKIEILSFCFETPQSHSLDDPLANQSDSVVNVLGLKNLLAQHNLILRVLRSNITLLNGPFLNDSVTICCPKIPSDTTARIGVRKSKFNPDKIERVFGFNSIVSTSPQLHLGLELPVGCFTTPADQYEGNYYIQLQEQIHKYHPHWNPKIHIGDGHYDDTPNYKYVRDHNAFPLFTYNSRGENLTQDSLITRGYNENGIPFAPCGCLTSTNGHDVKDHRNNYSCHKLCLKNPSIIPNPDFISTCPYINNNTGFTKHMSIIQFPRLILEIPRGSKRYDKIFDLRTSSERTNSELNDNIGMLHHPRVRKLTRAACLNQLACITLLFKRTFHFIIKITQALRKLRFYKKDNMKKFIHILTPPKIPKYLLFCYQKE